MNTIKIGDTVKMTQNYLDTLDQETREAESKKRYVVRNLRQMGSTTLVDFTNSQYSGSTLDHVEAA